jgi:hypothetical protein
MSGYNGVASCNRIPVEDCGITAVVRRRGSLLAAADGACLIGGSGGGGGGGGDTELSTELLDILKGLHNLGSFRTYKTYNFHHYTAEKKKNCNIHSFLIVNSSLKTTNSSDIKFHLISPHLWV